MKKVLFSFLLCCTTPCLFSQPHQYTVANAHSHNDYEQKIPFEAAYAAGFGSIEADIFLQNNELIVAHTKDELTLHRTLDSLYLLPLLRQVKQNHGFAYADTNRSLQMMIDIKTEAEPTLNHLIALLQHYPDLIHTSSITWVISGERPAAEKFVTYPFFIRFDGEIAKDYSEQALSKINMLSGDMSEYTHWNGKSNLPALDKKEIGQLISKAHVLHKPARFWGAPDGVNAWYQLMNIGVDYINTDRIDELASFFNHLNQSSYTIDKTHDTYMPSFSADGISKTPKNIILLIGDGCGLAEWYAGYTANKGRLNVFNIKNTGFSKTNSADNYITDSAPGSTAFASGKKTNNRFVGVDNTGKKLELLPDILIRRNIASGIVTSGDLTDATPADFYAHRSGRDSSDAILQDLSRAPVWFVMGLGNNALQAETDLLQQHGFTIARSLQTLPYTGRFIVADSLAGLSVLQGRKEWLSNAFDTAVRKLSANRTGFFLVLESAQIDYGGHANSLPYIATEVTDFDKVIGKALRYADADKETLVIITADHETGGLSLLDGDIEKGYVSGHFSTNDHTGIPVPVFAYGPQSQRFTGVYENTEVFYKIIQALGIKASR